MTKLLAVTTFAALAFAVSPAAACDWNREASTADPAVATAAPVQQPTSQAASQAATAQPQAPSVAAETSPPKPADVSPVVLVTDRH